MTCVQICMFTAINFWYIDIYNFTDSVSLGRATVVLDSGRLAGGTLGGIVADGNFSMCVETAFYNLPFGMLIRH